jgi:hypothetical protein
MALDLDLNLPSTEPAPNYLTLDSFKRGVVTLIDESRLPKNALKEAINIFLYEDGQAGPRPGVGWYGAVMPNGSEIRGFDYFDFSGVVHLVAVAGGVVYRSTNDGSSWTACTGGTLTTTAVVNMNQNGNYLYLTTGLDNMLRYDGTTVLQSFTALATPGTPTATKTGLAATTYNYYYKVSAVNQVGFTAASAKATASVSLTRDAWDTTTNYVTNTVAAVAGATRYDWYLSEDDIDYFYLGSSTTTTFKDDGSYVVVPTTKAPTQNTTQGEKYEELTNVGSRQYGVRNRDNRYRIGFTGTDVYAGAFSYAYGGGYVDWQTGGKLIPVKAADYRDGKGTPYATIWCSSADGQGATLQMSIDSLSVGDVTIDVPSIYLLPGSRGTPAPGSVVNVLNDYMFYNSQAFYNLGSRAQFLNLLSTDEASANIRPTVKQITTSAESGIASVYSDAKVYFSIPLGSTTNNYTAIFDTEQKAWLPQAFTLGFKKFLRYTSTGSDGSKIQRLLAIKPGDNQLSEISAGIQGDYGQPFATSLITGLFSTTKNRFDFQFTEEAELEFSNPQGTINVELVGTERNRGFGVIKSLPVNIQGSVTNVGWDTFGWDVMRWDDTSVVPDTYSESSVKRYFPVQKEMNTVQWHITTQSLDSRYITRTLQTWGTETLSGKPRAWKI